MNLDILEYYKIRDLEYRIIQILPLFVESKEHQKGYANFIDSINSLADDLNFDKDNFHNLLNSYIKSKEKKDSNNLNNYLKNYLNELEQKVIEIPNDINKAYDILRALTQNYDFKGEYQVYDAFVLLKDEINEEKIEEIFDYWKKSGDNIWISFDFMEGIDAVSHYRFKNIFEFGGFDSVFKKQEFELQFRLLESIFAEDIKELSFDLWIIDRIPEFTIYNKDLISFVLRFIARSWNPKGFWESNVVKKSYKRVLEDENYICPERKIGEKIDIISSFDGEEKIEWEPSNYITSLLSLNLLKHPVSDEMREMGIKNAEWLANNQNYDGSWSDFDYSQDKDYQDQFITKFSKGAKFKPDLLELFLVNDDYAMEY